ncbi:PREDICTED: valacyclovir hydrolase-like isoform X2 [Priapulus caudatus]|uniref:Valacyclovir hydrolase-like isoform X2 n=1 Tax=Priapulus caudatus TaxID=37621 RepID=A0ABM1E221_PRICU|nr:PREDICTED: valacyclovir hydrolase-like isoform X2 [Priapulus caudatus]
MAASMARYIAKNNTKFIKCLSVQKPHVRCLSSKNESALISAKEEVNGVNFHYVRRGAGEHPILLMPGALGSGSSDFGPQLEKLDGSLFTIIAWDPRGYGKSIPPARDFPLDFFHRDASDATGLMNKLGFKKFSMLGWSDGGITALVLAGTFPDVVRKMVVWGSNATVTEKDMKMYDATRDIKNWSERMKGPMLAMYGEGFQKLWSDWIDGFDRLLREKGGDLCLSETDKVRCPTLIIHGQKDAMVGQEHADYLHSHINGSKLVLLPDGKHNLHFKYATEFNQMVTEFLTEKS